MKFRESTIQAEKRLMFSAIVILRQRSFDMLRFAVVLFLLASFSSNCMAQSVFKCGNNSVSIGDSTLSVYRTCGKPTSREVVGNTEQGITTQEYSDRYTRQTSYVAEKSKIEKWEYNKGYGDFIYILMFEGGFLRKIENGGRGG